MKVDWTIPDEPILLKEIKKAIPKVGDYLIVIKYDFCGEKDSGSIELLKVRKCANGILYIIGSNVIYKDEHGKILKYAKIEE